MAKIVLCALNARYTHSSLALRSLMANLGPLRSHASLVELTIGTRVEDMAEELLAHSPDVIGLSVAIWSARPCLDLVALLRQVAPEVIIVLGGPEVSHEHEEQPIVALADYVVAGEGELAFFQLCQQLLDGRRPPRKMLAAAPPDLSRLALPYELYGEKDIEDRVIYVEASRGCPYRCAFCLSALDAKVRYFPLDALFSAFVSLLERGARRFKFVDRTFNLDIERAVRLLDFFAERPERDLFLHLEAVPDRLPDELMQAIRRVGPERLQLELGVQSLNDEVLRRIGIRRGNGCVLENLERLADLGVHTHADLIAGLPGEALESLGRGFDQLWDTGVDEIQLGVLKRLRGAPVASAPFTQQLRFAEHPPYEVLSSDCLDFAALQEIKRAAYVWDRVGNSGNFDAVVSLLAPRGSLFETLTQLTRAIFAREGRVHAIALDRLAVLLFEHLSSRETLTRDDVGRALVEDYQRNGRKLPSFLRPYADGTGAAPATHRASALPERQARRRRVRGR